MKITVFNGSPRGENSNTHIMVKAFLEGAKKAGAEVENVFLVHKKIKPCVGCFSCWLKTPGECVIKDDVAELHELMKQTDIIVYASPIYVGSVTGIMKNFIDRMIPFSDPHFGKNEDGLCCHAHRHECAPDVVLISNCGFPEMKHFDYFRTIFEYMDLNSPSSIIAEIYRSQGEMLKGESPLLIPLLMKYKGLLKKAGEEIVKNHTLSEETKAELVKPLIPEEQYIEFANKYMDKTLAGLNR